MRVFEGGGRRFARILFRDSSRPESGLNLKIKLHTLLVGERRKFLYLGDIYKIPLMISMVLCEARRLVCVRRDKECI